MKMPKVRLNKVHSAKYDLILELEKLEVDQLEDLLKLIKLYPNITSESIEYCKEQFELQNLLKELIRTNDTKHITLYICTNATRIDDRLIEILKQFKDVVLSISIDGVGRFQ